MIEYRVFFMTSKGSRKGPAFSTKDKAVNYGDYIRNVYGYAFKVREVVLNG